MAYKEAIKRTSRLLNDHIRDRAGSNEVSSGEFTKDCLHVTKIFGAQAKHLQETSTALVDQALDLYIDVNRKNKIYGKEN